jgi:hypothetical protein
MITEEEKDSDNSQVDLQEQLLDIKQSHKAISLINFLIKKRG